MTDRELMQQALNALEEAQDYTSCPTYSPSMTQQCAIAAVARRARLAQPETEPVAWMDSDGFPWSKEGVACRTIKDTYAPLYIASPRREWVGLTEEERLEILAVGGEAAVLYVTEAKLKEKNT